VVPLTVDGKNFQEATAVVWNCAAGPHGWHIGTTNPGVAVQPNGAEINLKTIASAGAAIAVASKQCGFTSGQQSFPFEVRVKVGSLYSPRSSGDWFVYHKV
jgi:hypothetical protein